MKYPIGKAQFSSELNNEIFTNAIHRIERLPAILKRQVEGLNTDELQAQYRENSWTIQQVVHHIADSHMNGFVRTKWALSESKPVIKPYNEKKWTEQPDVLDLPIEVSLNLIESIHTRWTYLFRNLSEKELNKVFIHPDGNIEYKLFQHAEMYAWHGDHHLAHVKLALGLKL